MDARDADQPDTQRLAGLVSKGSPVGQPRASPIPRHACEENPPGSRSDMSLGRPGVSADVSEALSATCQKHCQLTCQMHRKSLEPATAPWFGRRRQIQTSSGILSLIPRAWPALLGRMGRGEIEPGAEAGVTSWREVEGRQSVARRVVQLSICASLEPQYLAAPPGRNDGVLPTGSLPLGLSPFVTG